MSDSQLTITTIGGPTALIELAGLRLLTDPTFDPAGTDYPTPVYVLHKLSDPALGVEALGRVDAVLLSHDHHFDNLDRAGRDMLKTAGVVLTTQAGAERLGGNAIGLAHWAHHDLTTPDGRTLRVTATPARHGPEGGDRGPAIGFALTLGESTRDAVYFSGDTVWYEGVEEVARRFTVRAMLLNMGAARVKEVGPAHLTLTAEEGVQVARAFPQAAIIPLHFEGWAHFSEGRQAIQAAFEAAGLADRLRWPEPGKPMAL